MKVEIECDFLTLEEVFEQIKEHLYDGGKKALLGEDDTPYEETVRFEWDTEEIAFEVCHFEDDPRVDGTRTEYVDYGMLDEFFSESGGTIKWAKNEAGKPILLFID